MKKIFVIDSTFTGHHKPYFENICKIKNVEGLLIESNWKNKNFFEKVEKRCLYIKNIVDNLNKADIIHFLYGDPLYIIGDKISKLKVKKTKLIFTIHHNPQNYLKYLLLKRFSKYVDSIIVHSNYQKDDLSKIGIYNVQVVEYPAFLSEYLGHKLCNENKYNNVQSNKLIFSLLGGTRKDKGLDVFLKSLKYLAPEIKNKIMVVIKGKEEYFTKKYIEDSLKKHNIEYYLKLDHVSDLEFLQTIVESDAIVIPYKKIFTGSSGPMIEAMYNNIPVIAPNYKALGYYINEYENGYPFEIEDPKSLAKAIEKFIEDKLNGKLKTGNSKFKERFSVDNFLENHQKIYEILKF